VTTQTSLLPWLGDGAIPQASPDSIVAVVGLSGIDAVEAMGLQSFDFEEL
jgi:hypothetical protein